MLKVPAVLGCGSRTFPSVAMASDVSDVAIAACSPSRGKGYGARTSRDGGVMAEPWLLVDGRWQQRFAEVEEKSTQQASRNQEFFTSDEEDGLGVTSRTGRVDLELEFAEHETVIAEFLSKVAEFGWANLEADAVDAASGFVKKLTGTTFTGGVGFDVYTGAATFVGMQADPFASGASGCDAESSVSLGESFAQLAVKEHGWSELKEHESPESLREEGCPESFYSGTLAEQAVWECRECELEDREPPESFREVGCPESFCSGTLAQHAVKEHGQKELKDREPPESLREVDPLADLLTAGDEPAFVAYAKQMLPSDWLQRTFRQRKRFLGTLRRSHFGGQVSGAGSPLLQAGRNRVVPDGLSAGV